MSRPPARRRLLAGALVLGFALAGCVSVPDDIRDDFSPPDGKRPNNFGRTVEAEAGKVVQPDTPSYRRPGGRTEP